MAHKKGLGSSRNGRDSNAKRLGVKANGNDAVAYVLKSINTAHGGKITFLTNRYAQNLSGRLRERAFSRARATRRPAHPPPARHSRLRQSNDHQHRPSLLRP